MKVLLSLLFLFVVFQNASAEQIYCEGRNFQIQLHLDESEMTVCLEHYDYAVENFCLKTKLIKSYNLSLQDFSGNSALLNISTDKVAKLSYQNNTWYSLCESVPLSF